MVPGLINLTFHGLGSPPHAVAESERAVWVSEQRFGEILDAVRPHPSVRITFDDGNGSDHSIALRALVDRGLTATFFVLGARTDQPGYLDRAQLRELVRAGMRIGTHGMEHRPWRGLSAAETEREMTEARRAIEGVIGTPIREASCPFGAYDRRVLRALRERRYERVFTSDRLPADDGAWFQPRYTVHSDDDAPAVQSWLQPGGASAAQILQRLKVFLKRHRI
jgi:peptidoglycan/xylan/chitin deacetylase (PgdA/CDA1 family)